MQNNDNVTPINKADEERIAQMKSDAKIIAIQLAKLTVLFGAGYYIVKKLKAASEETADESVEA